MKSSFYFVLAGTIILTIITILRIIRVKKNTGSFADERVNTMIYMVAFLIAATFSLYKGQKMPAVVCLMLFMVMSFKMQKN